MTKREFLIELRDLLSRLESSYDSLADDLSGYAKLRMDREEISNLIASILLYIHVLEWE